ncbi:hypothetical protein E2C01_096506 [Portunus trituberculatus]|uniref:Uncharacterized protein n=1 Tax=Portunus trituberculatus TaxID=210409 RepID=A0A5B7K268_PORTR|nr:hypothetical protein [Portunus trituberculatus]
MGSVRRGGGGGSGDEDNGTREQDGAEAQIFGGPAGATTSEAPPPSHVAGDPFARPRPKLIDSNTPSSPSSLSSRHFRRLALSLFSPALTPGALRHPGMECQWSSRHRCGTPGVCPYLRLRFEVVDVG